jgi:hypothetical protein
MVIPHLNSGRSSEMADVHDPDRSGKSTDAGLMVSSMVDLIARDDPGLGEKIEIFQWETDLCGRMMIEGKSVQVTKTLPAAPEDPLDGLNAPGPERQARTVPTTHG